MLNTPSPGAAENIVRRLLYALTGLAVLAGIYVRFKGLGFSPLAIDEYYLATSVKNILEHGLPQLHGGGYYVRGIALQYMVAPLFLAGLDHGYAFRLVTVLFNLAALPAVFLLARHLAGVTAGCLALILFSLAVWEVEFARFARMYAPFGTLLLWHVYLTCRRVMLDDRRACKWMWLISTFAIFVSEYAVFLALLNFLPGVLRKSGREWREYVVPVAILAVTYKWQSIGFRRLGVDDYLPAELLVESAGRGGPFLPVHLPPVLLPDVLGGMPWLLAFLVPLLVFLLAARAWVQWGVRRHGGPQDVFVAGLPMAVLLLALLNLFSLAAWAALLMLLLSGVSRRDLPVMIGRRPVVMSALSIVASLAFWCLYLAVASGWQARLPIQTGVAWKDGVLLLFNYPNMLRAVIVPWRDAMPLQGVLMGSIVLAGAWVASARPEPRFRAYLVVTAILLGMFILVPVFRTPYFTLRYSYPLYGLILILVSVAMVYLLEPLRRRPVTGLLAGAAVVSGLMLLAEDFDARHLLEIDSERVTYRMGYPRGKEDQYYLRFDYRGPAEFVNANLGPADIVISAEYSVPYYLDRLDYLYIDAGGRRFGIVASRQGTRDIWEDASLLFTQSQLYAALHEAPGRAWLIVRSDKHAHRSEAERDLASLLDNLRVYRSVDGHLDVYLVSPKDRVLP